MELRRAEPLDLPGIVAIYNHAILHSTATFDTVPVTVEERRPWLDRFDDDNPCVVAVEGGDVVGFAYYLPYRPRLAYRRTKELTVYVDAKARGLGCGRRLYEHLIAHARQRDVHVLVGVVAGHNPASAALHQRCGFEVVGVLREVGWKFDRWLDTTFWQRTLRG